MFDSSNINICYYEINFQVRFDSEISLSVPSLNIVAEPISMSTPQMSYVSQSNMKEQRRDNNYNKRQFICRIYKRVCKCPRRLYVVFS